MLRLSRQSPISRETLAKSLIYVINSGRIKKFIRLLKYVEDIDMLLYPWGSYGYTLLHLAIARRDLEMIKILIEHGANVDICLHNLRSPISISVGNPKIMKLLIDAGADVNTIDEYGCRPLCYDMYWDRLPGWTHITSQMLVDAGADRTVLSEDRLIATGLDKTVKLA